MRRVLQSLGLSGLLLTSWLASHAFAEEATDEDAERDTSAPKQADKPSPLAPATPVAVPTLSVAAPPSKPKVGDVSVSGYFRGSLGASNQRGRMTCFQLALPGQLVSKYRLGNECEVWSETHFTVVTYAGDNGSVATMHFMPTVYIPTTFIGYTPTGVINSPLMFTTSTGATLSFPNLYADIKGVSWLAGGTAWMGTRYYKRESVYISDFFYWNPSGVGAGIEDINIGPNLRLSYAAFAVDGRPPAGEASAPPLTSRVDFGLRNDLQLRGIRPYESGEFQIAFQYIADFSNNYDVNGNRLTHGGWGVTVRHVQQVLGGDNKLAFQYGRGAGTGFGTLAAFYYPDFSLYHDPSEFRIRVVDVLTVQPSGWLGAQVGLVYQHDDLGTAGTKQDWYSAGSRVSVAFTEHFKLLGEAGYDRVEKSNGAAPQFLTKLTVAPAITAGKGFLTRPELRVFYTWALWNDAARTASIDSGRLYVDTLFLSGSIFGLQAETWW
jgi:maltoporin